MTTEMISADGRDVLAAFARDAWALCQGAAEVEEVLVYLHLDEGGYLVEPAYRVGGRWWSGQFLDQALTTPVGSDARHEELTGELGMRLLTGAGEVLEAPSPSPSRVVVRWTPPDGELGLDASAESFDLDETTTFDVFEAWWEKVERTGDTSVSS